MAPTKRLLGPSSTGGFLHRPGGLADYGDGTEGPSPFGGDEACSVCGRLEQVEPVAQPAEGSGGSSRCAVSSSRRVTPGAFPVVMVVKRPGRKASCSGRAMFRPGSSAPQACRASEADRRCDAGGCSIRDGRLWWCHRATDSEAEASLIHIATNGEATNAGRPGWKHGRRGHSDSRRGQGQEGHRGAVPPGRSGDADRGRHQFDPSSSCWTPLG
jgi:hypothetical protein